VTAPIPSDADFGRRRQASIFLRGLAGRREPVPAAPDALEARARKAMSTEAWTYVAGGAGAERTMAANRAAFDRWRIVPRVLRDVGERDTSITLFGRRLPSPFLLAPVGVLDLAHRDADVAASSGARAAGVPIIWSNQASVSMEACARAMDAAGGGARWFQLYPSSSDALIASLVKRAEACGCDAIVLTLDTTMLGWRPRDLDLGFLPFLHGRGIAQYTSDPVFRASLRERSPTRAGTAEPPTAPLTAPTLLAAFGQMRRFPGSLGGKLRSGDARRAVERFIATYSRPTLTWEQVARIRALTRLPLLLKGVLHPDDARRAREAGADGIVVSNHGGRQVDGAIGALDALPGVVAAAGGLPVLFDSGVRTGTDAFKALALGAAAVCVGRPYVYGLAIAGERGVATVLSNLRAELDLTLGLAGLTSIAAVTRDALAEAPR
jgi:lactate 2-monooxygenase